MTLSTEKKQELAKEFGKDEKDVGSAEVQVAFLTERIRSLESHFELHRKDNHSRRGLIKMVSTRRKLLKYFLRRDYDKYQNLINELGIRR